MKPKTNKSQVARDIVASVYSDDKVESNECRSTAIARIKKSLKCKPYMAATYHGNAVVALLSVEERTGTIAERLETGKPVWSVVKISSEDNPITTSFYMFSTKKAAVAANGAFRYDGVYKGEQTKGELPVAA